MKLDKLSAFGQKADMKNKTQNMVEEIFRTYKKVKNNHIHGDSEYDYVVYEIGGGQLHHLLKENYITKEQAQQMCEEERKNLVDHIYLESEGWACVTDKDKFWDHLNTALENYQFKTQKRKEVEGE